MPKSTDEVTKWVNRVDGALKFREKEENLRGWKRFLDEYEGKYPGLGISPPAGRIIPINLVFSYVHTEIPKLYFRDPYVAVNPKGIGFIEAAKILEVAVNYLFTELNLKHEVFKVLLDSLLVGHGWMKFGYAGTFGRINTHENLRFQKKKKDQMAEEINEFVKSEEIFATHVPWQDIVFDQASTDPPYDSRWIAHRVVKPIEAVKNSEVYENTDGLKSNFFFKGPDLRDLDYELVELWEIWDKDSGTVMVVSKGHEKFLRKRENKYFMEGLPFSMLKFNPIPGKPYPLSDIGIAEPQFLEKIKIRTMMLNHMKRWSRQVFVEKGSVDDGELEKFSMGIDGSVIIVNPGGIQKIRFPEYPPMQSEIFQVENLVQIDTDAAVGQNQVERGQPAQTRTRTLGEVQFQLAGTQSRSDRRRDVLEDFVEEVCRKIIQLLKQFQLTPRYVRNLEQDPAQIDKILKGRFDGKGLSFTREDIQAEVDVEVKMGSMIPLNKENRLQILEKLLGLGPNIGLSPNGPVARAIGREIFRDLNVKEAERAYAEEEAIIKRQQEAMRSMALAQAQAGPGGPSNGTKGTPVSIAGSIGPAGSVGPAGPAGLT